MSVDEVMNLASSPIHLTNVPLPPDFGQMSRSQGDNALRIKARRVRLAEESALRKHVSLEQDIEKYPCAHSSCFKSSYSSKEMINTENVRRLQVKCKIIEAQVLKLRAELERPRITVYEASQDLIEFVLRTEDPLMSGRHKANHAARTDLQRDRTKCCTLI